MDTQLCSYVRKDGNSCNNPAISDAGLCFWHDPSVSKQGPDIKAKLEAVINDGHSIEGFQLKRAQLEELRFKPELYLETIHLSRVNFDHANLKKAHLFHADLSESILMKADLTEANLNRTNLTNTDLLGTRLSQTKLEQINWGNQVRQERAGRLAERAGRHDEAKELFAEAEEVYRHLFRACDERKYHREAGYFYHREMTIQRYGYPFFSMKRAMSKLVDLLCGYGEKPMRVVGFSLFVITTCAFIYCSGGLSMDNSLLRYNSSQPLSQNIATFFNCFYFSVVTFTTLGYGDITPVGLMRLVAAGEAFMGSFTMALFVVVFVRKMMR